MNPVIVTYVGLVVAILVLAWGAFEIIRRYGGSVGRNLGKQKEKINVQTMHTWPALKPTSLEIAHDPLSDTQETPAENIDHELHSRAQQNGHFSESKKNS